MEKGQIGKLSKFVRKIYIFFFVYQFLEIRKWNKKINILHTCVFFQKRFNLILSFKKDERIVFSILKVIIELHCFVNKRLISYLTGEKYNFTDLKICAGGWIFSEILLKLFVYLEVVEQRPRHQLPCSLPQCSEHWSSSSDGEGLPLNAGVGEILILDSPGDKLIIIEKLKKEFHGKHNNNFSNYE